jgi:hypothetical protein
MMSSSCRPLRPVAPISGSVMGADSAAHRKSVGLQERLGALRPGIMPGPLA